MIRQIVAYDQQYGIAKNGSQPWSLPGDEAYFSSCTKQYGGVILMGRKTYEVIGRPLPDRQNFVLTSHEISADNVTAVHDLEAFLSAHEDVWIIGGAELYQATLDRSDELYITKIAATYGCDQFYPNDLSKFVLRSQSPPQTEGGTTYQFWVYAKS